MRVKFWWNVPLVGLGKKWLIYRREFVNAKLPLFFTFIPIWLKDVCLFAFCQNSFFGFYWEKIFSFKKIFAFFEKLTCHTPKARWTFLSVFLCFLFFRLLYVPSPLRPCISIFLHLSPTQTHKISLLAFLLCLSFSIRFLPEKTSF